MGAARLKLSLALRPQATVLRALPVRRDYELTVNFSLSVEPQADSTSAKDALEQQIGNALGIAHEIRRALKLVSAGLEVGLHGQPFSCAFRHFAQRAF